MGLLIQLSTNLNITTYSDANCASNIDNRKSVAAYCVYLSGTLVFWSSKKQIVVALAQAPSPNIEL